MSSKDAAEAAVNLYGRIIGEISKKRTNLNADACALLALAAGEGSQDADETVNQYEMILGLLEHHDLQTSPIVAATLTILSGRMAR